MLKLPPLNKPRASIAHESIELSDLEYAAKRKRTHRQRFLAEMELIDLSIGFVEKTIFVQVRISKRSEYGTHGTLTAIPVTWAPRTGHPAHHMYLRSSKLVYRGVDAKSAVAPFETSTRVMNFSRNGAAISPYRCEPTLFK